MINANFAPPSGFDLPTYVDKAFTKLRADVDLQVDVTVGMSSAVFPRIPLDYFQLTPSVLAGDYPTRLTFTQHNVSVKTDTSLNLLLPIVAQPIVQKVISGVTLGIEKVLIKDVKQDSFTASLQGSLSNAGPCELLSRHRHSVSTKLSTCS